MTCSKKAENKSILVVDDEQDVLDFLKIYLESLGWDVTTCESTSRAFNELESQSFFLVITDIAMPDMDGYEFVSEMKSRQVDSQVVLMTGFGYNPNHTLVKLNRAVKHTVLFKPFDRSKLSAAVQTAFDTYFS